MGGRKKKYCFISGLPRSGSTVLCNILAQNPRFRSDGVSSGMLDLILGIRESWEKLEQFRTWKVPEAKRRVLRGAFHSFYEDTDHPVVFDKCRGWPSHLELAESLLEDKARVIVTVRDMRAVMASWERLWRKSKDIMPSGLPQEAALTVEGRVKHWGSASEPTGRAYLGIKDAIHRGFSDRLLFVDFDRLTRNPDEQLRRIYTFIGEEYFRHDFERIEQKNIEEDPVPWMRDLHTIRKKLEPVRSDWQELLGPPANGLADSNKLWQELI